MNKFYIIGFNILLFATACKEDDNISTLDEISIVAQGDCMAANTSELEAILCITDMEGNAKTSFGLNQNFIVSLTFQNYSGELVKIKEEYIANVDVMTVIGANNGENFGKPFNFGRLSI
jgi:hypothetical protein